MNSSAHCQSSDSKTAVFFTDQHVQLFLHAAKRPYNQQGNRIGPGLELGHTGKYLEAAHDRPMVANRDNTSGTTVGGPTYSGSATEDSAICELTKIYWFAALAPIDNPRN